MGPARAMRPPRKACPDPGKEPVRRRAERRDHASALLPSDALSRQQQHLLPGPGADRPRRNADLLHRQHADPGHARAGRHLHHGRTGQRQAVLLRFRLRLHAQHHRDGRAVADRQRYFLHPSPRRSLRGPSLPLRLRSVDGALEAVARPWAIGPHAQGRHQDDDRRHEDDDPVAHGLLQRAARSATATRSRSTNSISATTTGFATTRMASSSATGGGRTPRTAPRPTGSTGMGCRSSGPATGDPTSSRWNWPRAWTCS